MLSQNILSNLINQITAEFGASQFYLQLSNWFEYAGFEGFAKYFRNQANEEREHGLKINDYILINNEASNIGEVPIPGKNIWNGCIEAFSDVLELEMTVTSLINNIYKIAIIEGDYATMQFLDWYVAEQVQAVRDATTNLAKIKLIGIDIGAVLEFDEELGDE